MRRRERKSMAKIIYMIPKENDNTQCMTSKSYHRIFFTKTPTSTLMQKKYLVLSFDVENLAYTTNILRTAVTSALSLAET